MTILADMILIGWIPVVLVIFVFCPPRRAVLVALLVGWLFLPVSYYRLPGLPDYSKMTATCVGLLIGVLCFDFSRLASMRLHWIDLPILTWCSCAFASSMANDLGVYDALASVLDRVITWGVPYLIGRLYFGDRTGLLELATAIFIGGLIYIPFCLYEIRMSPQLHRYIYGINLPWGGERFGGYRPSVFLQNGLMLGLWMTATSCIGLWLWRTGAVRSIWGVATAWLSMGLLATTVLCKSLGALVVLSWGLLALFATRWFNTRIGLWCLIAAPVLFCTMRMVTNWQGDLFVEVAEAISPERAESLRYRTNNDNFLIDRALQRPIFGWGGWGRNRIRDETGRELHVTDGLWIIVLGRDGLLGLTALGAVLLLPGAVVVGHFSSRELATATASAPIALFTAVNMYALDNLVNAMLNPVYVVAIGGLSSFVQQLSLQRSTDSPRRALPIRSVAASRGLQHREPPP